MARTTGHTPVTPRAEDGDTEDPAAGARRDDIAIVGMACRFPGAPDLNRYRLIDLAREAVRDAGWETRGFDREETSAITSLTVSG
ncbi:hypothetical protein [Streptomyces sp. NPDC086989]|uniref:hypothetical protein n=1 Tax=Streptomyces sp. NPDC086989 TaxID=3365764 RepID=UPI0038021C1C